MSKKKRTIHDVSRDRPQEDDFEYLNSPEFKQLPDRSCAIVLAAHLEAILEEAILYALPNGSEQARIGLARENGPLATFSNKTQIAFALNLITPMARADLDAIRHIRNAFAHASTDVRFDTPEIAKECDKLQSLLMPRQLRMPDGTVVLGPRGPRDFYNEACVMIHRAIGYQTHVISLVRDQPDSPQIACEFRFCPGDPRFGPDVRKWGLSHPEGSAD